jgi:hypothetical protein
VGLFEYGFDVDDDDAALAESFKKKLFGVFCTSEKCDACRCSKTDNLWITYGKLIRALGETKMLHREGAQCRRYTEESKGRAD